MPTTALGLLIFVVLLAPGLTYSAYRAASKPVDKPSALRELGGIALRSVVCDLLALVAFAVIHHIRPRWTPNVAELFRHPRRYVANEYDALFWWGLGLLIFACVLALLGATVVGSGRWARAVNRGPLSWVTPQGGVTNESAWWGLFTAYPDSRVYVGCTLDDGTYLAGWLLSYSPDSDETEDRELVLVGPVDYRDADAVDTATLDVGAVTVSARRLQYLTVSYLPSEAPPAPPPESRRRSRWWANSLLIGGLAIVSVLPLSWPIRVAALVCCLVLAVRLGRSRTR